MVKNILTYNMRFLYRALLLLGLFLAIGNTAAFAQFAVSEDFRGSGNPAIIIGDQATLTSGNADPVNQGWLRLTTSETYKKGYAYINNSFPSSLGVLVDFEFKMWRNTNADGADGIGVYLFDGTVNPFALGAYGGSLGYAGNPGLKGGYVGIGLDAYGNFSNPTEGRNGGPGVRANAVVLRGPTTTNAGTTNPFLKGTTITVNAASPGGFDYGDVLTTTNNNRSQNVLDWNTTTSTRPTDDQFYRRMQIEIERLTTGGQYKITVRWKTKVTDTAFTDIISYTTTDVPPALLKLGFAASTGGDLNFHEIRNLMVTTPNNMRVKKTANKDWIRGFTGTGSTDNLITYTIEITNASNVAVSNVAFSDTMRDGNGNPILLVTNANTAGGFYVQSITPSATGFTGTPTFVTNPATGTITSNNINMAANSVGYVTITGRLTSVPAGNTLSNSVTVTPAFDDDMNNNTSVVDTPVLTQGTDVVPTFTVDDTCADGSNSFTLYASNTGTAQVSVGPSNGDRKLRLVVRIPITAGFNVSASNYNGWTLDGTTNAGGFFTSQLTSNQNAVVNGGATYPFPITFTVTNSNVGYTPTATISYLNSGNGNIEDNGAAATNNTSSVSINAQPAAPTVANVYQCQGDTPASLTATRNPNIATTAGYTFKWYYQATGGFSSDFAPKPATDVAGTQSFWVSQVNNGCEGPRSRIYVYTAPTPTAGSIAADQYLCNGANDGALLTSVTPGTTGPASGLTLTLSYKWQYSSNNGTDASDWTDIANSNSPTYDPPATNANTRYYRRITISTNTTNGGSYQCFSAPTNSVLVARISTPNGGTISNSGGRVCYNGNAVFTTTNPGSASITSYQWQYSLTGSNPGFNWVDIPGANQSTYTSFPLTQKTYFRRIGINQCGSKETGDIGIDVTTFDPGSLGPNRSICPGASPGSLGATNAGGVNGSSTAGGVTYRWESAPGATGGTFTTIANQSGNTYDPGSVSATTRYRRYALNTSDGAACESATAAEVLVTVQSPTAGSITSNQTICQGNTPQPFTSATGGAGTGPGTSVTYQWQLSYNGGPNPSDWSNISGATNESYQPVITDTSTWYRRITVSNTNGTSCQSGPTNILKLTVTQPPNPGNIAPGYQAVCYGATPATITSSQAGSITEPGTVTYAWEYSVNGGAWTAIPGETGPTYSPGAVTQNTNYRRFAVASYGSNGCRSGWAPVAQVVVMPVATGGTIGTSQTICSGSTPPTITNVTNGTNAGNYVWQTSTDNTNWTTTSTTSAEYYPSGPITQTTYYRRFGVSNGGVSCTGTDPSNVVVMTLATTPVPGGIGSNQTICANTAPALLTSSNPGSGGTGYQWQSSTDNTNFSNIAGATSATYQPGVLTTTTYFRRSTLNGSCTTATAYTASVTITVSGSVNAGSITANQTKCNNVTPDPLSGTGGSGGTYRWDSSTDGGVTWNSTGVTTAGYTFSGPLAATTYFRRAIIGSSCTGTAYSNSVIITVTAAPTSGGTIASDQTICSGNPAATITSSAPGSVTTYRWDSASSASGPWGTATGTANGATYSPGVLNATTYFRRATISGSCETYSNIITITVNPSPTGGTINANQTVCSGNTPQSLTSGTAGSSTTYRWYASTDGGTTWTLTSTTTVGYAFTGPLTVTTQFRRASVSGSCEGYSNTVTVTVVAAPTGGSVTANQTICYNTVPGALNTSTAGTGSGGFTYRWDVASNAAGPWATAPGTANGAGYTPTVALTATTYYRRTTIPTAGSCEAYSNTITITVAAQTMAGSIGSDQNICMDNAPAVLGSATVGAGTGSGTITYKWEVSNNGTTGWTVITGATGPTYQPPVLHNSRYYRRTTLDSYTANGNTANCESGTTAVVAVITRNCKVITNPMIYQRVKN